MGPSGVSKTRAIEVRNAYNESLDPVSQFKCSPVELSTHSVDRCSVSIQACKTAVERAGWKSCSEAELNAALCQLVDDAALARRDCVDSGFLIRDAAGTRYKLS